MELAGLLVVDGKVSDSFLVAERKKGRKTYRGKDCTLEVRDCRISAGREARLELLAVNGKTQQHTSHRMRSRGRRKDENSPAVRCCVAATVAGVESPESEDALGKLFHAGICRMWLFLVGIASDQEEGDGKREAAVERRGPLEVPRRKK